MRAWLMTQLIAGVTLLPEERMYQASALDKTPTEWPFLVYRFGLLVPSLTGDDEPQARRQSLQVWAHDRPGDYDQIESTLAEVKEALRVAPHTPPLIRAEWVEDSEDLQDEGWGTITRFSRFHLITGS